MKTAKKFQFALAVLGVLSTVQIANAAAVNTNVSGLSGPWSSAANPSFNWGTSVLPPAVIDSSSGLSMASGNDLTINYISGCVSGGWGCYDANGWPGFGDLSGKSGPASYFINPSQGPIYFMALLGAFTDTNDAIVGNPFKIGNGPVSFTIPSGASRLSMGFNDGDGQFFDNGGVITVGITETTSAVPLPATIWLLGSGLAGLNMYRRSKKSA